MLREESHRMASDMQRVSGAPLNMTTVVNAAAAHWRICTHETFAAHKLLHLQLLFRGTTTEHLHRGRSLRRFPGRAGGGGLPARLALRGGATAARYPASRTPAACRAAPPWQS